LLAFIKRDGCASPRKWRQLAQAGLDQQFELVMYSFPLKIARIGGIRSGDHGDASIP
jgi:hypothetical protein